MSLIGQGVVALSNRIGSAGRLKELLGGPVSFVRKEEGSFGCANFAACATAGFFGGGTVEFYNILFNGSDSFVRGTAVHELAHIIDFNNVIGDAAAGWEFIMSFSDAFAEASGFGPGDRSISTYGQSSSQEYWGESLPDWVYGPQYPSAHGRNTDRRVLDPLQVQWINRILGIAR